MRKLSFDPVQRIYQLRRKDRRDKLLSALRAGDKEIIHYIKMRMPYSLNGNMNADVMHFRMWRRLQKLRNKLNAKTLRVHRTESVLGR